MYLIINGIYIVIFLYIYMYICPHIACISNCFYMENMQLADKFESCDASVRSAQQLREVYNYFVMNSSSQQISIPESNSPQTQVNTKNHLLKPYEIEGVPVFILLLF